MRVLTPFLVEKLPEPFECNQTEFVLDHNGESYYGNTKFNMVLSSGGSEIGWPVNNRASAGYGTANLVMSIVWKGKGFSLNDYWFWIFFLSSGNTFLKFVTIKTRGFIAPLKNNLVFWSLIHSAWLRCSSVKQPWCPPSSRLAVRAPRHLKM